MNLPKKLFLRWLQTFDLEHDTCFVRSLEMVVDATTKYNGPLIFQFWKDVALYGVDEAVTYLRPYVEGMGEIDQEVKEIKEYIANV